MENDAGFWRYHASLARVFLRDWATEAGAQTVLAVGAAVALLVYQLRTGAGHATEVEAIKLAAVSLFGALGSLIVYHAFRAPWKLHQEIADARVAQVVTEVRTFDWGRISEWSNDDLKNAGRAVAAEMRAFEANHLEQFRIRRGRRQSLSPMASESAKQWRTQEIMREESEVHAALDKAFRTQFLSRATAVRRECFARIGLPQQPTPSSAYFSTALDVHLLAGTNPVTEAAEQIETLTGLLP